jgi:alpha-beta hydrolase superfamily lysophospholipase
VYAVDMIGDAGLSAPSRPPLSSEAHALWLDDVLQALALASASLVGVSLGGWLALDYATRRPDRVESVAVLCPAGVGRQKISIVFKTHGLRMLGAWGRRKAAELVLGRAPANPSPAQRYFLEFFALIHKNFRRRMVKLPIFSDAALRRLTMPMLVVVGGKDVLIDSTETKRRLERNVPQAEIRYLPEAGHFIPGQTAPIRTSSVACLHLTSHKATSRDRSRRSDRGELAGLGVIGKNEYNVRAPHCEFGQPRYSERLRTGDGGRVPARGWKHATGPRLLSRNRPR